MLENPDQNCTPTGDSKPGKTHIGTSPEPIEANRLVQGKGIYVADVPLDDPLHLGFVRSPFANSIINSIELDDVRDLEGVAAAYEGKDVAHLGTLSVNPILGEVNQLEYPVLAHERVSAVGQPVAAVLAEQVSIASDALEMVWADLEEQEGNPRPELPGYADQVLFEKNYANGDCKSVFETAELVVEAELKHPLVAPSPMENRGIAIAYDEANDIVTIWLSTQTPHRARNEFSKILGVDRERIHVVAPDVGGAFGLKASVYPEEVFAVWAAFQLKRSVRWISSRSEDLLAGSHGRGLSTRGRLALDREGKFLAIEANVVAPIGNWMTNSCGIPAWNASRILPGPYHIDHYDLSTKGIRTDGSAVGIYRGAGRPEAAMLMEVLVDKAAKLLKLDPIQIREQNLIQPDQMPLLRNTGAKLDSGNYPELLNRLSDLTSNKSERNTTDRSSSEITGSGLGFFVEPCGTGWESAKIRVEPDGTIRLFSGGSTQGHNRITAYRQIVADSLECDPALIQVELGDTRNCPEGIGALASRSTAIGGSAVVKAARAIKEQLETDCPPETPLEASVIYEAEGEAWGYGCYHATVSIDIETGVLKIIQLTCMDDAGTLINPALVEGQLRGGIAQGLGATVMEQLIYDDGGQLLTGSLMDYALPRAEDMPEVELSHLETPSPANLLGAKGVGEAGTIGVPAAIYNAVLDALTPLGVTDIPLPLTSQNIWQAIHSRK